jgi:selenide,water dikinase
MAMLNKESSEIAVEVGVNAATDVTGFGLLGHLTEMAQASQVTMQLYAESVPLLNGAWDGATIGLLPGGMYNNRTYLEGKIRVAPGVNPTWVDLLYTPETAGGMLLAVSPEQAPVLEKAMQERRQSCVLIGEAVEARDYCIEVMA